MRRLLALSLLILSLRAEDFIAMDEYGEKLYQNPRGISCAKCHGPMGKGNLLVTVQEGKRRYSITAPNIRNITRKTLVRSLNMQRTLMPKYRLTAAEIEALYIFLNSKGQ